LPETCYSLAIKNEFASHPGEASVDSIIELISKINDFSTAINAAKWAVKQFKDSKQMINIKF